MDNRYEKWLPFAPRDTRYDVDRVAVGPGGFSVVLVPDGKHKAGLRGHSVTLTWARAAALQISDECWREDCWFASPEKGWTFYRSESSPYLEQFRAKCPPVPPETVHYLLVGTNLVADILSDQPPIITLT